MVTTIIVSMQRDVVNSFIENQKNLDKKTLY